MMHRFLLALVCAVLVVVPAQLQAADLAAARALYASAAYEEALTMLAQTHYDLLITDWNMPEMNGLDLVKEVRRIDASKAMPICP